MKRTGLLWFIISGIPLVLLCFIGFVAGWISDLCRAAFDWLMDKQESED